MSKEIAELDLGTITPFQQELHIPVDNEEGVMSEYFYQPKKSSWKTHMSAKMSCTQSENSFVFEASSTMTHLIKSHLKQQFPSIKVNRSKIAKALSANQIDFEDMELCWPHNLGHNLLEEGKLLYNEDVYGTLDSRFADIWSQYFMKPGFRDNHALRVGNIAVLEDWADRMPAFTANIFLPWFYMESEYHAIPLFLMRKTKIRHALKLRNKIIDLLRMRKKIDGKWVEVKPSEDDLIYLEGVGLHGILKAPEMWGRYGYIDKPERDEFMCKKTHTWYIRDVIHRESNNTATYGKAGTVDIDSKTPTTALFWVAENNQASNVNNRSNYSTNPENIYQGWDPIDKSTLNYGGQSRFKAMESDHFNQVESEFYFRSAPFEPGYHALALAHDPLSLDANVGIVFENLRAGLVTDLLKSDPHKRDTGNEKKDAKSVSDAEFRIHVYLMVTRKLVLTYDPKEETFIPSIDANIDRPHPHKSV